MGRTMRRVGASILVAVLGCSFSEDFDRFTRGAPSSDGKDAGENDAAPVGDGAVSPAPLALDHFERVVESALGTAEVGGTWNVQRSSSNVSVRDGWARVAITAAASNTTALLPNVASDSTDARLTASTEKLGSGSGLYLRIIGRRTSGGEYGMTVAIKADGGTVFSLTRTVGGADNEALGYVTPDVHVNPNESLRLRLQVSGHNPTRLRGKIWTLVTAEPPDWQSDMTDSTPTLQGEGAVGLNVVLSSQATNAPFTVSVDDFVVVPAT